MSSDKSKESSESYSSGMNFEETELSLGLPGEPRVLNSGRKRGFQESVDLRLGGSSSSGIFHSNVCVDDSLSHNKISNTTTKPPAK